MKLLQSLRWWSGDIVHFNKLYYIRHLICIEQVRIPSSEPYHILLAPKNRQ